MFFESKEDRKFRLGCTLYFYMFCALVFGIGGGIYLKNPLFPVLGIGYVVVMYLIFMLPGSRKRHKAKEWEESRAERAKNSNADDYFRSQK